MAAGGKTIPFSGAEHFARPLFAVSPSGEREGGGVLSSRPLPNFFNSKSTVSERRSPKRHSGIYVFNSRHSRQAFAGIVPSVFNFIPAQNFHRAQPVQTESSSVLQRGQ